MLTRLQVSGFKNLVNVDVRFGPFTCIAGPNGVGKSNLFDAIRFLSSLADRPIMEAALAVRNEEGKGSDVRSLFHQVGQSRESKMTFLVEMIVPNEGFDDLGQRAKASITFLRYKLELAYREDTSYRSVGDLELIAEELTHINLRDASKHILFPNSTQWRHKAIQGRRTSPFISTKGEGDARVIELHQDGTKGRPLARLANQLPRTVLSAANAAESKTALLARREMQSWRLLQLEPSALRMPDEFTAPAKLKGDGSHLAATLARLAHEAKMKKDQDGLSVYAEVANRLSELIEGVKEVRIDRDEKRQLLTLILTDKAGTSYPARALSDGTLRFLALVVLELDPQTEGLICLEEPENGIHPERIPAILSLLKEISVDVSTPVGADNPLRQMIVNTHSPSVVSQVDDDSLLVAELRDDVDSSRHHFNTVTFGCLPDTWRTKGAGQTKQSIVARGKLLAYLNPTGLPEPSHLGNLQRRKSRRRVIDRPDLNLDLFSNS